MSESEDATDPDLPALLEGAAALGVNLPEAAAAKLLAYLDAMLEENRGVNLTSIRDRSAGVVRHLLDSLSVAAAWERLAGPQPPRSFLDVGTGGGFPGAPLAVVWPRSRGLLVDGTGKKVRAVLQCLQVTQIGNAEVVKVRAEQLHAMRPSVAGSFDLCVARAVGPAARMLDATFRLIAPGGRLFVMKGRGLGQEEIRAAEAMARRRGLQAEELFQVQVPGLDERVVLSYRRD